MLFAPYERLQYARSPLVEVICQKEHLQPSEKAQNFALYSQDDACLLNSAGSLQQNGVENGHRLLLL